MLRLFGALCAGAVGLGLYMEPTAEHLATAVALILMGGSAGAGFSVARDFIAASRRKAELDKLRASWDAGTGDTHATGNH